MEFEGKVVVITGAGKGIGKIAAEKFSAEGASVAVASRTDAEIERAAAEIRSAGGAAIAVPTDISEAESVQAMIDRVITEFGQIDVLINNAAMPGRPGRSELHLWEMELDDWDFVYGINVRGTMMCSKYRPAAHDRTRQGRQYHRRLLDGGTAGDGQAHALLLVEGGPVRLHAGSGLGLRPLQYSRQLRRARGDDD